MRVIYTNFFALKVEERTLKVKSRVNFYPLIRREFETREELADVINKSVSYCQIRLSGQREFSFKDKKKIAEHIGVDIQEVRP